MYQSCDRSCNFLSGYLYLTETYNHVVRQIHPVSHTIITIAGKGYAGYSSAMYTLPNVLLDSPKGITGDSSGSLYVVDQGMCLNVSMWQ